MANIPTCREREIGTSLTTWFENNYKSLGFDSIIKKQLSGTPDFICIRNGKQVGVELEIKASNFIRHGHPKKVDFIVCLENDIADLNIIVAHPKLHIVKEVPRYVDPHQVRYDALSEGEKLHLMECLRSCLSTEPEPISVISRRFRRRYEDRFKYACRERERDLGWWAVHSLLPELRKIDPSVKTSVRCTLWWAETEPGELTEEDL